MFLTSQTLFSSSSKDWFFSPFWMRLLMIRLNFPRCRWVVSNLRFVFFVWFHFGAEFRCVRVCGPRQLIGGRKTGHRNHKKIHEFLMLSARSIKLATFPTFFEFWQFWRFWFLRGEFLAIQNPFLCNIQVYCENFQLISLLLSLSIMICVILKRNSPKKRSRKNGAREQKMRRGF